MLKDAISHSLKRSACDIPVVWVRIMWVYLYILLEIAIKFDEIETARTLISNKMLHKYYQRSKIKLN